MTDEHLAEIIRQLVAIKHAAYAMLVVLIIAASASMARLFRYARHLMRKDMSAIFQTSAEDLFSKGRVDRLVDEARFRLESHPNDYLARWYYAKGLHQKGERAKAIEQLEILEKLAPEWKEQYTAPFVKAVREEVRSEQEPLLPSDSAAAPRGEGCE